ncbi:MAG TPA: signal peptidase I [Kiritimatiellia bacterium]|nr:signal peptidase I [Kiritimatiellia bacterium]HMP00808.1 signal peptidase I [Kiritimatiellia bacterium]
MKRCTAITLILATCMGCSTQTFYVPSESMTPTIPVGSSVTINFSAYRKSDPARFDLVAFKPPEPDDAVFVFRVIGLPNETITLSSNRILADGIVLTLPKGLKYKPADVYSSVHKLGPTQYFLLGDNTDVAYDSRYIGPTEKAKILGKVTRIEHAARVDAR